MSLDLLLKFSEADQQQIWQQTQSFTVPSDRWNAYLNHLCLKALLPWLQESSQTQVCPNAAALPNIWSFVNGTAVTLNGLRLVIIPTEAIDRDELRIAQEWIDLPNWAADYYLAVQIEPDDCWVKVWGYTTHRILKTRGHYDVTDRTYTLPEDDLFNLSVLWLSRELVPEATRADISPLPTLSVEQANNLLDRLSSPTLVMPRLAVPFQQWGALMQHSGWRQQLYQRRQGRAESSVLQWLRTGGSNLAQQLGWERIALQPSFAAARSLESGATAAILSRRLTIAGQTYDLRIVPGEIEPSSWRVELHSATPGGLVPGGFRLRLLTEDLQPFADNEAIAETAVEALVIEVALEAGEGIVWEIEPVPEGFEHEILRF